MLAGKVRPLVWSLFSDGGKQSARQKNGSQVFAWTYLRAGPEACLWLRDGC